jgi:hypothetical protein
MRLYQLLSNRKLRLGNPEDLTASLELWSTQPLRTPAAAGELHLLLVLALFCWRSFFTQKGHVEYLWLALHELLQAPIGFVELAGSSARLDTFWYAAVVSVAG